MAGHTGRQKGYLKLFASYYKPHWKLFLLDMVCALCICIVDLLFPMVSRWSMQTLLPQKLFAAFFGVMAALIGAYVLKGGLYYIVTYWGHLLGVRMEADIRRDLFAHMQDLSFSFYDKNRTGQLMSRATNDLFEITELAHHGPEDLFISVVTLAGAFCLMCTIQWRLALIVFAVVPLFVLFTIFQRRKMVKASLEVKQNMAGINGELESAISGMRTAKAFANEKAENEKFRRSNERFKGAKRGYYKAMAGYMAGLEFALPVMNVLTIAAGGYFILRGQMDFVDLVTFSLYISTFLTPVRKLAAFVEQFLNGMAGFKRFLELMGTEPAIKDAPDARELGTVKGDILVDDVSFRYNDDEEVLSHVSIHIAPGETVAVVGPSGGGKSTLCQLIPRFYDVTGGRILVDGVDVRQVKQRSLRQNIGIVQQDVFLFAGTILENIRYGRPDATEAEVAWAAKQAEIYDDIMAMPDGFETYVGERGVMLSGGQKQRVSIARIFLKNPPVLILDEATSALDTVTEERIQSAFDALAKGRTTLIIAHRLSTIRGADRIIVVDQNRILEEGTHQELMALGGEYAALYNAQRRPAE
ncbi:MAG TPA: ABC transporter ATP-binding protein [Candidatus Galloscillospira stercoripullorum]|nr:ABC transporter ATP-binding protein [Candidatus Galloscillospira stercoripullorum]